MADHMEWRPTAGFEKYEVSEFGDLRKVGTISRVKGFLDSDGYVRYVLRDARGVRLYPAAHQLVARAFLGEPSFEGAEVAHADGSRLHCHHSNLRWATVLENHADKREHGTTPAGERNPRAKITEADVHAIRRDYRLIKAPGSGRRLSELDERYGLCRVSIIRIATGESWQHVPMPSLDSLWSRQ